MAAGTGTRRRGLFLLTLLLAMAGAASGGALVGDRCPAASAACGAGMRCATCSPLPNSGPSVCCRTTPNDPKTHGTGLPFNKYSWLTTHNSFAITGTPSGTGTPIISPPNQEDSVTSQLNNGVRGLMLDTYDFKNDLWLCHSFSGKCFDFTAYVPASKVLGEIRAFLDGNPAEVVTVFVEDYAAPGSLGKVLAAAGLTKYMFPVSGMPKNGGDWPLLKDMVAQNHRLIVFTSKQGKEGSDGVAHEWSYVVETQYGSEGLVVGACPKRGESKALDSKGQSLVLMNFFTTNPSQIWACANNSAPLIAKLKSCYDASAARWPNFIAVDFYMRSSGGGPPLATDVANGRLQCGCDTIAYCKPNAPFGTCTMPSPSPSPPASPSPPHTPSSSPSRGPSSLSSPSLNAPSSSLTPAAEAPTLAPSSPVPRILLSASSPPPAPHSSPSPTSTPHSSSSPTPAPHSSSSPTPTLAPHSSWSSSLSPPSSTPARSPSPSSSLWSSLFYSTASPAPDMAPSMSPSSWPYGTSLSLSPSSSSSPEASSENALNILAVHEPPPKSSTDELEGTIQEMTTPESTRDAGVPQRTSPKSIAEAPAPEAAAPDSEADESSGASVRPKTPSRSSLFGLTFLVLISLC